MRHTIEDKRRRRNSRKKRKRHQQRELKRTAVIENALRDVRASADQQRTLASKYYKLWKRSVDTNKKLQDVLNKSERQQKVMYKRFFKSSITHLYTQQYNILMYILLFIQ